ncbi:MAG: hypothetical protein IPG08_11530 [Sphingobacteriaceae bacterium]|nr:hypothetical protein [Sphingobacteriaceae bacterium]
MKKLVFTIAAVAAFSFANAQEQLQQPAQTPTKKKTAATTTAPKEGATKKEATHTTEATTSTTEKNPNAGATTDPKKSGTRMAINEKGLPGEKKSTKGTTATTPK